MHEYAPLLFYVGSQSLQERLSFPVNRLVEGASIGTTAQRILAVFLLVLFQAVHSTFHVDSLWLLDD